MRAAAATSCSYRAGLLCYIAKPRPESTEQLLNISIPITGHRLVVETWGHCSLKKYPPKSEHKHTAAASFCLGLNLSIITTFALEFFRINNIK